MNPFLKKILAPEEELAMSNVEQPTEEVAPDLEALDTARVDQELTDADAMQSPFPEMEMSEQVPTSSPVAQAPITREQVLSTYQQLKNAQNKSRENANNLGILGGFNKVAQGVATGYGAKIDANEAGMKQLLDANAQEPKDIMDRIKIGGDEMNDVDSDISKFMREQAYAVLKKMNPESDYAGKLEGMSAAQLQKLPGMKNVMGQNPRADFIATDRVTKSGHPVKFNKMTGTYIDGITNEPITDDQTIVRDIARRDPVTGNYGYVSTNGGMQVVPTSYGTIQPQTVSDKDGKPVTKDVTMAEITTKAPKLADDFNKQQKEYIGDMKEARDTATSVTNLANKLANGDAKGVDSGMLGGIQTQAAKMAGQKGVLTDQDLVKFAGAGGWEAAAKRASANAALGQMSDADLEFFRVFADKMGKSLEQDINNRTQIFTRQAQGNLATIAPGITEANVNKLLGADVVAPAVQDKSQKSTSNTVKVKGPSGQVAEMTEENAKKYLSKPGYQLVK